MRDPQFWLRRVLSGRKRSRRAEPQPRVQPPKPQGPRRKAAGPKSPTHKVAPSHPRLIQTLKGFPVCGVKRISLKDDKVLFSLRDGDLRVVNLAHSRTPCLKIVDKQRGYDVADFGSDNETIWAVRGHEMDLVLIQCTENGYSVVLEGSAVPQPVIKSYFAGDLPFVIVCGANKDTSFSVMAHSGNVVKTYSSKQIENNDFAVGGALVGAASWSAGVQMYSVSTKTLDSDPLKRAVMLPTLAGADAIAINRTGSKTAIIDKAGRLQTYNTDCYFGEQERARLLQETTVPTATKLLRFSHDSLHLVMACGADIVIRDASTLQIVDEIRNAHVSAIRCLETSRDSPIFVTTCLQGNPRVWRI
ncbi:MAG: uncharacterized protein KVP18_000316 [Porospora cf. gigantea A]|nr:MAG: hypothetical protein KVP18_000316 [Porospora cf. gigantea A]